jgi:SAM-dependent methyltransferase
MTSPSSQSEEAYIKQRYTRWRGQAVPFDYKKVKSARLAQILRDTGGLPPRALELGVGPGGIAGPLSRNGFQVIGLDLSPEALERAREYCRDDRVVLLRGSGFALPFQDESIPLVYASQVLHLFDDAGRLRLMQEVRRVLRRGGRFVFDLKNVMPHAMRYWTSTVARRHRNFPSTARIEHLLQDARFGDVEMRAGVIPGLGAVNVPNIGMLRSVAHTRFFNARKP